MFSLVLYVIVAVFAVLYACIGLLRGAKKSIASLACGAIALLLSVLITVFASGSIASAIPMDMIKEELPPDALNMIESFPSLVAVLPSLMTAIVMPIVFVLLFVIISFLLLCFRALILLPFKSIKDDRKMPSRLIGLGTGLVKGLLVAFVLFIPVTGYLSIADNVIGSVGEVMKEEEYAPIKETYDAIAGDAKTNVALSAVKTAGGQTIFDTVASISVNGKRSSITKEVNIILEAVSMFNSLPLGGEGEEMVLDKETIDSLKDMISDDSESSVLIQSAVVDVVTGLSDAWLNGESFMDMSRPTIDPEIDPYFNPILDSVLSIYADTTTDTLGDDVGIILDMLGSLTESGVLEGEGDPMEILTGDFMVDLVETLEQSGKAEQVMGAVTDSAIAMAGNMIGIKGDNPESYQEIVNGAADIMNEALASEDPSAVIEEKIADAIEETEIAVPQALLPYVADKFAADFADKESVTGDDIKAFIEGKYDLIHGIGN